MVLSHSLDGKERVVPAQGDLYPVSVAEAVIRHDDDGGIVIDPCLPEHLEIVLHNGHGGFDIHIIGSLPLGDHIHVPVIPEGPVRTLDVEEPEAFVLHHLGLRRLQVPIEHPVRLPVLLVRAIQRHQPVKIVPCDGDLLFQRVGGVLEPHQLQLHFQHGFRAGKPAMGLFDVLKLQHVVVFIDQLLRVDAHPVAVLTETGEQWRFIHGLCHKGPKIRLVLKPLSLQDMGDRVAGIGIGALGIGIKGEIRQDLSELWIVCLHEMLEVPGRHGVHNEDHEILIRGHGEFLVLGHQGLGLHGKPMVHEAHRDPGQKQHGGEKQGAPGQHLVYPAHVEEPNQQHCRQADHDPEDHGLPVFRRVQPPAHGPSVQRREISRHKHALDIGAYIAHACRQQRQLIEPYIEDVADQKAKHAGGQHHGKALEQHRKQHAESEIEFLGIGEKQLQRPIQHHQKADGKAHADPRDQGLDDGQVIAPAKQESSQGPLCFLLVIVHVHVLSVLFSKMGDRFFILSHKSSHYNQKPLQGQRSRYGRPIVCRIRRGMTCHAPAGAVK